MRAELASTRPELAELPLLAVDVTDRALVDAMTAQTQVVLTTAGPFATYGPPVVASCVAQGADYVDITGEPGFVAAMIREHHEAAERAGLRIVSCCGFDSIPHDLGAWFTAQHLPCAAPIEMRAYVEFQFKTSGGTWNTALEGIAQLGNIDSSGLVYQGPDKRAGGLRQGLHRAPVGGWAVPLPLIDPLIVARSAQLIGYGPQFRYGHFVVVPRTRTLVGGGAALAMGVVGAQIGPIRRWLQARIPPGTGPTMAEMEAGWGRVTFAAREGETEVRARVTMPVDPGYLFTARMGAARRSVWPETATACRRTTGSFLLRRPWPRPSRIVWSRLAPPSSCCEQTEEGAHSARQAPEVSLDHGPSPDSGLDRREVLLAMVGVAMGCDQVDLRVTDLPGAPTEIPFITPTGDFYVVQCCGAHVEDPAQWSLRFADGDRELARIDQAFLDTLEVEEVEHTLQCIGLEPGSPVHRQRRVGGACACPTC